jgi:hypothetical protein
MQAKRPFLERASLFNIHQRVNRLKAADLRKLSPQQLRSRIGRVIDDYPLQLRRLNLSGICRARKNPPGGEFTKARELWYPPAAAVTKPGRLNGVCQVRLYAASMANTTVLELKPEAGDVFTILVARTKSGTVETISDVAFIGVERSLAPERGSLTEDDLFRASPSFRAQLGESKYRKWLLIDDFISEILGERVDDANELKYKLTGAFGDLIFEAPQINAVTYPSVATNNYGLNICLLPEKADALFRPSEAWEIVLGEQAAHVDVESPLYQVIFRRRSREITPDGAIEWLPPGVGLDPESVAAFARHRLRTLASPPRSV